LGGVGLGWIALHPPHHAISPGEERNVRAAARQTRLSSAMSSSRRQTVRSCEPGLCVRRTRTATPLFSCTVSPITGSACTAMGSGWCRITTAFSSQMLVLTAPARRTRDLWLEGIRRHSCWVDWVETNEHPRCMFGLGESMGAAQLLQIAPKGASLLRGRRRSPRLRRFVKFGVRQIRPPISRRPLWKTFFRPTVEVGILYVRLRYGLNMEQPRRSGPSKA